MIMQLFRYQIWNTKRKTMQNVNTKWHANTMWLLHTMLSSKMEWYKKTRNETEKRQPQNKVGNKNVAYTMNAHDVSMHRCSCMHDCIILLYVYLLEYALWNDGDCGLLSEWMNGIINFLITIVFYAYTYIYVMLCMEHSRTAKFAYSTVCRERECVWFALLVPESESCLFDSNDGDVRACVFLFVFLRPGH